MDISDVITEEPCVLCQGSGKMERNHVPIDLDCIHCAGLGVEYLTKKQWHSRTCKDKKCKDLIHSDLVFAFRKVVYGHI